MPSTQIITAIVQGRNVQTNANELVPWWSYAKTVLASAALTLVAQDHLKLDEVVSGKPFTLRQLLQHRAGLRCYGTLRTYHAAVAAGEHPWSSEEMLRRADAETLSYEPGHGWGYSNIGYLFVRNLIETQTGMPLGPALEHLVFAPFGISGIVIAREPADLDVTAWAIPNAPSWLGVSRPTARISDNSCAVSTPSARRRPAAAQTAFDDERGAPG